MEPPIRGRGRGYGQGRGKKSGSYQYGANFPALGSSTSQSVTNNQKKTAKEVLEQGPQFIKKKVVEHVLTLSENDLKLNQKDPWYLKERYLQTQQYAVPEGKFRYIYEAILTETSSVQIFHHYLQEGNSKTPITHSKCHIVRVLHPHEWGLSVLASRTLKLNEQKYNYWDYTKAWTFAFYYQNPIRSHSWIFTLNPDILKTETKYPLWFLHWWESHSPELGIFPDQFQKNLSVWVKCHPILSVCETWIGQDTLWFCSEFQINWIWQWGLQLSEDHLGIPELQRNFSVKWWSRFDSEKCLAAMSEVIKQYQENQKASRISNPSQTNSSVNYVNQLKLMIQKQYPDLTSKDQKFKLVEVIKEQYLSLEKDDNSDESDASMASEADLRSLSVLARKSEDQKDGDYPTNVDLWNSLVDSLIEIRMMRDKRKRIQK